MKLSVRHLCITASTLLFASLASAQSAFDLNIGFGSAHASANGGGIDNASSSNAFGSCILNSGDSLCQATPSLGGFFLGLGGDLMLYKHFGVGAEVNLQPAKSDYGPLQYRQSFYDFNGIYSPINQRRFLVQLQGGVGGAKTSFSFLQSSCVGTAVCTNSSLPVGNTNHFQAHFGAGVQIYLTQHIFVRPQFDVHYVPNFDQQFGTNTVPSGTVWVGYSFGER
jgi:hypothetical protein